MSNAWSATELSRIDAAPELHIAVRRDDGSLGRRVPIWVVSADEHVYVRSWYRRDTSWFGDAVRSRRARIDVPGLDAEVTIENIGDTSAGVTAAVDDAYRAKYGHGGAHSMITPTAAASTLRLDLTEAGPPHA